MSATSRLRSFSPVAGVGLIVVLLLSAGAVAPLAGQQLGALESDIPFNVRMAFLRGRTPDSTLCLVTVGVENQNLLFFRKERSFESRYEVFVSMRESSSQRLHFRGDWEKRIEVPSYDETTLEDLFAPMQEFFYLPPGKYEGFVEVKDLQANTYGNGRISVTVPDFHDNLPKLSTLVFYEPGEGEWNADNDKVPLPEEPLRPASLKYPAGKPIFLLVDVYADTASIPRGWSLTAEVVKELMVFPQVIEQLADSVLDQRRLLKIPTSTMGLGTYRIDVKLRDRENSTLARTTSFEFRIIKSAEWVDQNYDAEVRYLKYLATEGELRGLIETPGEQQAEALTRFWARLDPVPATAVNELKVQYFERVDYANRHFTTEQKEGWETNMGEVYIMLGPPSEIYGSRLNQIWVYERENLVLTFFNHNLLNRDEFDEYIRLRRWWRESSSEKEEK